MSLEKEVINLRFVCKILKSLKRFWFCFSFSFSFYYFIYLFIYIIIIYIYIYIYKYKKNKKKWNCEKVTKQITNSKKKFLQTKKMLGFNLTFYEKIMKMLSKNLTFLKILKIVQNEFMNSFVQFIQNTIFY